MERPSRKEREFARRQEDILSAARALFADGDWESITVAQIAAKAEIGKGTFYKHFAGKDELFATLSLAFGDSMLKRFDETPYTGNAVNDLYNMVRMAFEYHLDDPVGDSLCVYTGRPDFQQRLSADYQEKFRVQHDRFERFFAALLAKVAAQGEISSNTLAPIMFGTHALFLGALEMARSGIYRLKDPGMTQEMFLDHATDFILAGVLGMETLQKQHP